MALSLLSGSQPSMPTIQGAPVINPMAGLSQMMQMIGLMSTLQNRQQMQDLTELRKLSLQQQLENGRTEKEKERILKDRYLQDYASRLIDNPDFINESRSAMRMSPGRREEAFKKIHDKYIEPLKYNYDTDIIKPKDVFNYLFYDKITTAKQQAQEIDDSRWSGFWDDLKADAAHLLAGAANVLPMTDAKDLAAWAAEQKQKAIANNKWLQDQELRRQQGEGFTDQSVSDMGRTLLSSLPTILGFTGATIGATALGGPMGGAAAAGALGGGMSDIDYVSQVMNSGADQATKDAALSGPERLGNAAVGAAFGALAPGVARPFRAFRGAINPAYKPMAAATSPLAAAGRQAIDTATGMSLMGAGQQVASNVALNSALGQDTPWYRGTLDAATQSFLLGLPMGGAIGFKGYVPPKPTNADPGASLTKPPVDPNGPKPTPPMLPPAAAKPAGKSPTPTPQGSGKKFSSLDIPEERVNSASEVLQQDAELPKNQVLKDLQDILVKSKDVEAQQLGVKLFNENKSIGDLLNDNLVPENYKMVLRQDTGRVLADIVAQAQKVIPSTAKAKKDSTVMNKLMKYLGKEDGGLTYETLLNRKASMESALKEPSIDKAVHDRLTKQLDEAFNTLLEKKFPVEGKLDAYVKEQIEQSKRAGAGSVTNSANDSGATAGTAAAFANANNRAAAEARSGGAAATSGEPNGTTPPSDGTAQTTTGAGQESGTPTGEGQAGRAGTVTDSNAQANASSGEPSAEAVQQPSSGQPEPTFGRSHADRVNDFISGNNISRETFNALFEEAEADLYDVRGESLRSLPEKEQLEIIQSYIDARNGMDAADNARPTDNICT